MTRVFLCGVLSEPSVCEIVFDREIDIEPAILPAYRFSADALGFPILRATARAQIDGVLADLDAESWDRLEYYARSSGLRPLDLNIVSDTGRTEAARVYSAETGADEVPWDASRWRSQWAAHFSIAAIEIMANRGRIPPDEMASRLPTIRMRAAATVRAASEERPRELRSNNRSASVEVIRHDRPYIDYFSVEEVTVRHPRFDGTMSEPLKRAGFLMGDAVTLLPYDPKRDQVLLIEQFRAAPFLRGDPYPWVLEPIAGRIDPGETPEDAARREAQEEAGLPLNELLFVASGYPSPGAVTEYLYSYVALADLPQTAAGLGGLDEEGEDIRAHVIPFDRLRALMESGEVDTGPLLNSALWLERERAAGRFA